MAPPAAFFLGLELSTEQLRATIVDEQLDVVASHAVDFDADLVQYQTRNGILTTPGDTYTTPVDMWVQALDLLLDNLRTRVDLSKIKCISGSAQPTSVWWTPESQAHLAKLSPHGTLHEQLGTTATFSLLQTLVAQDTSTIMQAMAIESALGGPDAMASRVGTAAHPSLIAAHAMKIRETNPEVWTRTSRVMLASAALCSLFLGRWAPSGDAELPITGLWSAQNGRWDEYVTEIVAGSAQEGARFREMLGDVEKKGQKRVGTISPYFVERFGFDRDTYLIPFTSDHLSTYLSLSPSPSDCIFSFGHTDVVLTSAPRYIASRFYTLLPHPAQHPSEKRRYIAMLLSRNAEVPRALVRDMYTKSWSAFDRLVAVVPPGGSIGLDDKLFAFWFLQPDTAPFTHIKGIFRFETGIKVNEFRDLRANPRCLIESQVIGMRVRMARLVENGLFSGHGSLRPSASMTGLSSAAAAGIGLGIRGGSPIGQPHHHMNGGQSVSTKGPNHTTSQGVSFDPYDSSRLPNRVIVVGTCASFPSVVSLIGDVFDASVFVASEGVQNGSQPPTNSQPGSAHPTPASRASLGASYLARWAWKRGSTSPPGRPDEKQVLGFEDEVRAIMSRKWSSTLTSNSANSGDGASSSPVGTPGLTGRSRSLSAPGLVPGLSSHFHLLHHHHPKSGLASLAASSFAEEEEDEALALAALAEENYSLDNPNQTYHSSAPATPPPGHVSRNRAATTVGGGSYVTNGQTASTLLTPNTGMYNSPNHGSAGPSPSLSIPSTTTMSSTFTSPNISLPSTTTSPNLSVPTTSPNSASGPMTSMGLLGANLMGLNPQNSGIGLGVGIGPTNVTLNTAVPAGSPYTTPSSPATPLPLPQPLPTDDVDAQLGLVKVAEPDHDSFLSYAAVVGEYCRLESILVRALV